MLQMLFSHNFAVSLYKVCVLISSLFGANWKFKLKIVPQLVEANQKQTRVELVNHNGLQAVMLP